jgi:hypothetical protein
MPNFSWRIRRKASAGSRSRTAGSSSLSKFWRNTAGGISVMYALTLPVLLGSTGLGVEIAYRYVSKRSLQSAADAAAVAAALELTASNKSNMKDQALASAMQNGFTNAAGTDLKIHNPPISGAYLGDKTAVEAVLDIDQDPMFSAVFQDGPITIEARAVARQAPGGDACILALNKTAKRAVTNSGSATLNLEDCIIASNSNANDSIYLGGSSTLNAASLWTVGNVDDSGGSASVNIDSDPVEQGFALDDPYKNVPAPSPTTPCVKAMAITGTKTVNNTGFDSNPTTICAPHQDIQINSGDVINFQPGVYVLDGVGLKINAGATVKCSACSPGGKGVTFVLTNSDPSKQAGTVDINGGATVKLNAPADGTYAGLLFFQDSKVSSKVGTSSFNGGANIELTGALYFPATHVEMNGNVGGTSECTVVVADTIDFTGNTNLDTTKCKDYGFETVTSVRVVLVE